MNDNLDFENKYSKGFSPFEELDNEYWNKGFIEKVEVVRKVNPNHILLGMTMDGGPLHMDLTTQGHVAVLGDTGCGKTVILRNVIDEFHARDYAVAVIPDVKNEFIYSREPMTDKKFLKDPGLAPYVFPHTLPMDATRPMYFKETDGTKPHGNEYSYFRFEDLTIADLFTLVLGDQNSSTGQVQKLIAQFIGLKIQRGEFKSCSEVKKHLFKSANTPASALGIDPDLDGVNPMSKRTFAGKIAMLDAMEVFGDENQIDFVSKINEGLIPVLNLRGYEPKGREVGLPSTTVALVLRQVRQAKKQGLIKKRKMVIIGDEFPRWCPRDHTTSSKTEFMEGFDLDRADGIVYWIGLQRPKKIDPDVLTQCRYVLIPAILDVESIKNIFEHYAVTPSIIDDNGKLKTFDEYSAKSICTKIKLKMQDFHEYSWLLIDKRQTNKYKTIDDLDIFLPFCPATQHKTQID